MQHGDRGKRLIAFLAEARFFCFCWMGAVVRVWLWRHVANESRCTACASHRFTHFSRRPDFMVFLFFFCLCVFWENATFCKFNNGRSFDSHSQRNVKFHKATLICGISNTKYQKIFCADFSFCKFSKKQKFSASFLHRAFDLIRNRLFLIFLCV